MTTKTLTVNFQGGLNSKGAVRLTHIAGFFESKVLIEDESISINAKSVMGVLSLCKNEGEELNFVISGKDEKECLTAIENFMETGIVPEYML